MRSVGVRNKFLILGRLVAVQSRNSGSWNTAAGEARQADDPQWVDFCQYSSTQEWLQWSRCGPGCKRNFMSGYGLDKKGMQMVDKDPDVDVQFVFGIKKTKALGLEQMPDEGIYKNYEPETEEHAMLVVNIVDTRTHRSVYRLTASRKRDDLAIPEKDLNREMRNLLSTFPANPCARSGVSRKRHFFGSRHVRLK